MLVLYIAIAVIAGLAAITKFHLMGKSHAGYVMGDHQAFEVDPKSQGVKDVEDYLYENFIKPADTGGSRSDQLAAKRDRFEQGGLTRDFTGMTFTSATAEFEGVSVEGEWTTSKTSDANRRILYVHGGAFTVGSAISHRAIISNLVSRTGCAVFAPNYRLMPENKRMASVIDSQAAYKWILENGPNGAAPANKLAVAGDSAGGNLVLMLSNWVRDTGLRPADAVIALSPATDSTFESPSIKGNFETDLMLKPLIGPLIKIPRVILLWLGWMTSRVAPANPFVSPLRADLSGLPPTLVHASSAEMLYDDARRYVAKAQSQGSDVTLQSWSHVCHVWQFFDQMLPASSDAFDEMAKFLTKHSVVKPRK